jgi:hypothetical protein
MDDTKSGGARYKKGGHLFFYLDAILVRLLQKSKTYS